MPCGQKCKEILDGGAAAMAAVTKSYECMRNSVLLAAVHDVEMPGAELAEFKRCADDFAKSAQAVALAIHLPAA